MVTGTGKFWATAPVRRHGFPVWLDGKRSSLRTDDQVIKIGGLNKFTGFVEEGTDHWVVNELFRGPRMHGLLNVISFFRAPWCAPECSVTRVHEGARRVEERADEFAYRPPRDSTRGRLMDLFLFSLIGLCGYKAFFFFSSFFFLSPVFFLILCMVLAATGPYCYDYPHSFSIARVWSLCSLHEHPKMANEKF